MPDIGGALDIQYNNIGLRQYTVILFKVGSTYYAKKYDGTLISSSTTAETVIAAALAQKGTLYFSNTQTDDSNTTTNWNLSGAFTGFTITGETTLVFDSHLVKIKPPEGYTGVVFTVDGPIDTTVNIYGMEIREQGTPANDWTGIKFAMNSATPDYMYFCKFQDIHIINPSIGIELETSTSDSCFITSCTFENILIWHPHVAGILFDERPNAQIAFNLFKDVNIQTDSNFTYGFKDVYGSANCFVNCAVWDTPSTGVDMNIKSTATGTVIVGGRIARNSPLIDQGVGTVIVGSNEGRGNRFSVLTAPQLAKYGVWNGISSTVGEGMFNGRLGDVQAGTGSEIGTVVDSTGSYRTFSTGTTINSLSGLFVNNNAFTRRSLNPYFKTQIRTFTTIANTRIYLGVVGSQAEPASAADPLNALEGVGLWYDAGVSANWRRRHNDSSGASVSDDTGVAVATSTVYQVEIYASGDSKFVFVFNGTHTDITTDIPASATNLGMRCYIENTTGADRRLDAYYVYMRSDR